MKLNLSDKIKGLILILFLAVFNFYTAKAQEERCDLDPVVRLMDSMFYSTFTQDKIYASGAELDQSINYPVDQLPRYTDEELMVRLQAIPSLIPMTYSPQVKSFIEMFVYKRRALMTRMLANSQIYFPMFEESLDRRSMPVELRYLPIIESAFNPQAVSKAGATGLWQLMHGTARQLGLDINSYVDERRDPAKSTEAAIQYLKMMYDIYGDWHLVLAAYNSGPGNVNKAIARSGGSRNFWTIMPYLPQETRSYVPIFIAAVYAMHYADDYKLKSAEPKRELYAVDTIQVPGRISLAHIAKTINMPLEELQFLNPSLRASIIPFTQNGFPLNLPVNYFSLFEARRTEILSDPIMANQDIVAAMAAVPKTIWAKVRKGETIQKLAARYTCSVSEIKRWNGLKSNHLNYGQRIRIMVAPEPPVVPTQTTTTEVASSGNSPETDSLVANASTSTEVVQTITKTEPIYKTHTVQSGDVLSKIAARYNTTVSAIQQTNKLRGTSIAVGQKLKIKTGERTVSVPVSASANNTSNNNYIKYVVQPGDTLWSIAEKYEGVTIQKLKDNNEFIQTRPIKVGDVIKIVL